MEHELTSLAKALADLIVPALAVAVLGVLKWLAPQIRDRIPGVLWPFAALYLARIGTHVCRQLDVACEGNFLTWSDPEAYVIAQGLAVIAIRELTRDVIKITPGALSQVEKLSDRARTMLGLP
jgi:hypothetical protein